MTPLIFSAFLIPLSTAIGLLYVTLNHDQKRWKRMLLKCTASFLYALFAGAGLLWQGKNPLLHPIFWFSLLCVAADALLEVQFIAGMLAFAAAHSCCLLWIYRRSAFSWVTLAVWAGLLILSAFLFHSDLKKMGLLKSFPFLLYAAFLIFDFASAVNLLVHTNPVMLLLTVGTGLFYISDMLVAKLQFSGLSRNGQTVLMVLYWMALYAITFTAWLPAS